MHIIEIWYSVVEKRGDRTKRVNLDVADGFHRSIGVANFVMIMKCMLNAKQ